MCHLSVSDGQVIVRIVQMLFGFNGQKQKKRESAEKRLTENGNRTIIPASLYDLV